MENLYIFCDESEKRGKYFSNFYGGLLIRQSDFERVKDLIQSSIIELNIGNSELKWSKVNNYSLESYKTMMNIFFDFIRTDQIKVRIMFTDNKIIAEELTRDHHHHEYHLLYYQFLKHAFGLRYLASDTPLDLEIFFDKLPDSEEKNTRFKDFIFGIQHLPEFSQTKISIKRESIYEVDSQKHILMQLLDIVLGSMAFRLNDKHKEKLNGSKRRGKRTIAKEELYKHINTKIREIRPNFNIGISTGIDNDPANYLNHSYRHWVFTPSKSSRKDK